uniref:Uncharacterized protein n=1 Tax=Rhizophora mucronata TaxID=61149 RepID=A0A2P2ITL4_RHIMU
MSLPMLCLQQSNVHHTVSRTPNNI